MLQLVLATNYIARDYKKNKPFNKERLKKLHFSSTKADIKSNNIFNDCNAKQVIWKV